MNILMIFGTVLAVVGVLALGLGEDNRMRFAGLMSSVTSAVILGVGALVLLPGS